MTTERRCICPPWMNARECAGSRNGRTYGLGDSEDDLTDFDDECECYCHVEQRAEEQDEDDLDRMKRGRL